MVWEGLNEKRDKSEMKKKKKMVEQSLAVGTATKKLEMKVNNKTSGRQRVCGLDECLQIRSYQKSNGN